MAIKDLKLKIINEAYSMIVESGIENFSTRDLSRRLGISHNTMYRHFASKQELIRLLIIDSINHLNKAFESISEKEGMDNITKIKECMYVYIDFAVKSPKLFSILYRFFDNNQILNDEELINAHTRLYTNILKLVKNEQSAKLIRKSSAYTQVNTIWSMGHGIAMLFVDNVMSSTKDFNSLPQFFTKEGTQKKVTTREASSYSVDLLIDSMFQKRVSEKK